MKTESLWIDTGPPEAPRPRLEGDLETDVVVLGGGIAGVTTALLIAESGSDVVLLEAGRLGRGVTGHTTAKVTSQHGMIYSRLRSKFGPDVARAYGEANEGALAWVAERIERDGIACDFRRQPAYVYTSEGSSRGKVEEEAEAAIEAGLSASFVEETPLPYPVEAAVRFDDQAEFHIRKYLLALAEQLEGGGGLIFEKSRAVAVDAGARCTVSTTAGRVAADKVVLATHYPFLDRSLAFARVHSHRSYAIVCDVEGAPPAGMYLGAGSPTRSIRGVPLGGREFLLVGGEGHRAGEGGDTRKRYLRLEEFARRHWKVRSFDYRWSTQDNVTIDGLPYVGRMTPREERILIATGFAKWGMTGGTAAALLLRDLALDRDNPGASVFDPNRFSPRAALKMAEENARVGLHFFGDRLRKRGTRPIEDLEPGEGDIVRHQGEKVAGHRRDDGTLVAVSTRCTHLGCQLNWNSAERSWDCPCHGSRFTPTGEILQGPALGELERKDVK